jgi:hypothetical protein
MTILWGAEIQLVEYAENTKRAKKSQALSEAEGFAVPRTLRGNVFLQSVAQWTDLRLS